MHILDRGLAKSTLPSLALPRQYVERRGDTPRRCLTAAAKERCPDEGHDVPRAVKPQHCRGLSQEAHREPKTLAADSSAQPDPMNVRTMDFDQVHYTLKVPDFADNPKKLELAMTWECNKQLLEAGGQAMLDSKYSDYSPLRR